MKDGRKIAVKLYKAIDTKIIIHKKVEGELNPFLPEWEPKLEARAMLRMIDKLKEHKRLLRLWLSQDGSVRCAKVRSRGRSVRRASHPPEAIGWIG